MSTAVLTQPAGTCGCQGQCNQLLAQYFSLSFPMTLFPTVQLRALSLPGFSVFLSWKWGLFPDIRIRGRVAEGPNRNSLHLVRGHNSLYLPPSASLGFVGLLEVLSLQSILIPLLIGHETVGWPYEGNVSFCLFVCQGGRQRQFRGEWGPKTSNNQLQQRFLGRGNQNG